LYQFADRALGVHAIQCAEHVLPVAIVAPAADGKYERLGWDQGELSGVKVELVAVAARPFSEALFP
jgi:hypothetical protein